MPQIIPIKDLKNTSEISERQIKEGRVKAARRSSAFFMRWRKCVWKITEIIFISQIITKISTHLLTVLIKGVIVRI